MLISFLLCYFLLNLPAFVHPMIPSLDTVPPNARALTNVFGNNLTLAGIGTGQLMPSNHNFNDHRNGKILPGKPVDHDDGLNLLATLGVPPETTRKVFEMHDKQEKRSNELDTAGNDGSASANLKQREENGDDEEENGNDEEGTNINFHQLQGTAARRLRYWAFYNRFHRRHNKKKGHN